ncbi:MAG: DUF1573 domain-containing protein [Planctomycetia bacterium]|nr:DUF1573 domain-containing protein [Planctomycetia bacterium]
MRPVAPLRLATLLLVVVATLPRRARAEDAPATGAPPAGAPVAAPRVTFDREAHDFGPSAQEQELRADFRLTNAGTAPLVVKNVRADCGCAGGAVDATELAPGATTTIRVLFRTLTMSGTLHKRIMVDTNDPARPTAELKLKADVFQGIVLAPARFFFGDVAAGSKPSTSMRVVYREGYGTPFKLTGVEAPNLDVAVEPKPCDDAGWHGYELTATFKSPPKVGTVSGVVIVRTDDPKYPRFTVPVQAFVSGKIWLDRRSISLGIVPAGRGRETAVIARAFGPGVELGTVTAKARKGVVEAKVVPSGKEWVVTIRLPESAAPGRIEDVIEITSSIPGEPPAEVLVVGSVTEPPK